MCSSDLLPRGGDLDQNTGFVDTNGLVELFSSLLALIPCMDTQLLGIGNWRRTSMMWRALLTLPLMSKEKRASTSVETLPGTMAKISFPNSTKRRSRVASTFSSMLEPLSLPYATATSMSLAYSGFFEAARIKDGLVVASWGLYLPIAGSHHYQHSRAREGCGIGDSIMGS